MQSGLRGRAPPKAIGRKSPPTSKAPFDRTGHGQSNRGKRSDVLGIRATVARPLCLTSACLSPSRPAVLRNSGGQHRVSSASAAHSRSRLHRSAVAPLAVRPHAAIWRERLAAPTARLSPTGPARASAYARPQALRSSSALSVRSQVNSGKLAAEVAVGGQSCGRWDGAGPASSDDGARDAGRTPRPRRAQIVGLGHRARCRRCSTMTDTGASHADGVGQLHLAARLPGPLPRRSWPPSARRRPQQRSTFVRVLAGESAAAVASPCRRRCRR